MSDLTPEEEEELEKEMEAASQRMTAYKSQATPQWAAAVGEFYKQYPAANLGTILSTARAYTDGVMSQEQADKFLRQVTWDAVIRAVESKKQDIRKKEDRSWWERNVYSKLKTGSRWTTAALNFPLEMVPGAVSQIFDSNDDVDGWFISTQLGTLFENDKIAGEGFFLGGRAAQLQGERVRRYRGEIDGHAWSLGRGAASVVVQPGTLPYNVLSGLVDTAVAVRVPAIPFGPQIKEGAKSVANLTGLRSLAGLAEGASAAIIPEKVSQFLDSKSGRKVIDVITEIGSVDQSLARFKNVGDLRWHVNLVDAIKSGTTGDEKANAVRQFLNDTLGLADPTRGIGPQSIDDINLSRWSDFKYRLAEQPAALAQDLRQRQSRIARLMAGMAQREIIVQAGTDRDKLRSVLDVKNFLKLLPDVTVSERNQLVEELARALATDDGSMRNVIGKVDEIVDRTLTASGASKELSQQLREGLGEFKEVTMRDLNGFVDDAGDAYGFGDQGANFLAVGKNGPVQVEAPLGTAGNVAEMVKHSVMLPDPRRIRRMTGDMWWLTGKTGLINPEKYGELRTPLVVLEAMQNYIWRPLTLLTGGYALRNMSDSMLRQSFAPTLQTGVFHPLDWIMVATGRKIKGDIEGISFAGDFEQLLRNNQRELAEATSGVIREATDSASRYVNERTTKVWRRVKRGDGPQAYRGGLAAELAILNSDPLYRRVADGEDLESIIQWLETTDDGQRHLKQLQNMWKNKTARNVQSKEMDVVTVKFIDDTKVGENGRVLVHRENIDRYVNNYVSPRIAKTTGNVPSLRDVVAKGNFLDDAGKTVNAFRVDNLGSVVAYNDDFLKHLDGVIDNPNYVLKETYKSQITAPLRDPGTGNQLHRLHNMYDRTIDKFFGELYMKRESFLNRSPAFRQFYYNRVNMLIDELTPQGVDEVIAGIKNGVLAGADERLVALKRLSKDKNGFYNYLGDKINEADRAFLIDETQRIIEKGVTDVDMQRYVGSKDLIDTLLKKQKGELAAAGKLSAAQLNAYAKGFALDETKKLFYNAAEKSNFADIYRVIMPFGSAWYEVTQRWIKQLARDPEVLKRMSVGVQGLRNFDPDNDGKGFFFKDPQTGEYVFNYPFSSELGPLASYFTGVAALGGAAIFGVPGAIAGGVGGFGVGQLAQTQLGGLTPVMQAPVRSLSMGLNLIPGLGPVAQIVANKIIPNKPTFDFARKLVLPYGAPDTSLIPSPAYLDKLYSAFVADPENDRVFGDMFVDTMRALGATGKYDTSTDEGREKLEKDAMSRARVLMVLRGLGQFVGPTRPTIEFQVDTKQGDMFSNEIAKLWYDLRAENYDTAVQRFTEIVGDDAFLYMADKTRSVVGGLDPTEKFGKWERSNSGVFARHPEVAGYFAPIGSKFDYTVFARQIETGKRERLTPDEMIAQAQSLVGQSLYRYIVNQIGGTPNAEQEEALRAVKAQIGERYPGFRDKPFDPNKNQTIINNLIEAANDPALDDNPVAEGLRLYFEARTAGLDVANARGFRSLSGKKLADVRALLRKTAAQIIDQFPEFERVYDRVLFYEIDVDSGGM